MRQKSSLSKTPGRKGSARGLVRTAVTLRVVYAKQERKPALDTRPPTNTEEHVRWSMSWPGSRSELGLVPSQTVGPLRCTGKDKAKNRSEE